MRNKLKPKLSWENAPDIIGVEELKDILGVGRGKAIEIFNEKNFPKINNSACYIADKEAVRLYLQGIKIKENSREAINYMILLELQKLNKLVEEKTEK